MTRENVQVQLSYLGDRAYIDISTLNMVCYSALGVNPSEKSIGSAVTRISKAVTRNGYLQLGLNQRANCYFEFEVDGQQRQCWSFIESGEPIVARRDDLRINLDESIRIDKNGARFLRPLTESRTHNFMILGKALIVANTRKIPRVVRAEFFSPIAESDYVHTLTTYRSLSGGFALLRTRLEGRTVLDVLVKLIS